MKIRKGKRRYAVIINLRRGAVTLTREGSATDALLDGLVPSFSCTFSEAKENIRRATDRGLMLIKR